MTIGVPSFITTLGTGFVLMGLINTTSHDQPAQIPADVLGIGKWINNYAWAPIIWAVLLTAVMHTVLTRTRWGLHTVSAGGNLLGAREAGINVGYQNMFLNREKIRWPLVRNGIMRKEARERLDAVGVQIPSVNAPVATLSGGQRQAIAVARSVFSSPKILLLDEPLAAMGVKEGAIILDLITRLKSEGNVSIIMIAHNYAQVIEVCDRINLIQGGQITLDKPTTETSAEELTELVVAEYRQALQEGQRSERSA